MNETMGEKTAIHGICSEISERGDWTTFAVDVGTQYPVKLSTKLPTLVELGRSASKSGDEMTWTYTPNEGNENPHKPGTYYVNRRLEGVAPRDAGSESAEQVDAREQIETTTVKPFENTVSTGGMSKDDWARKDSAIHKMACVKTAAAVLTHTLPSDPSTEDLNLFLERSFHLANAWHRSVLAERDNPDGSDVPF